MFPKKKMYEAIQVLKAYIFVHQLEILVFEKLEENPFFAFSNDCNKQF